MKIRKQMRNTAAAVLIGGLIALTGTAFAEEPTTLDEILAAADEAYAAEDYTTAHAYYEEAAYMNDTYSMNVIAADYILANGTEQDFTKGFYKSIFLGKPVCAGR